MLICKEVKLVHATLSISLVCLTYGGPPLSRILHRVISNLLLFRCEKLPDFEHFIILNFNFESYGRDSYICMKEATAKLS